MNIDLGSLAYGSTLENGVGTPAWGTSLGQSHPDYYITREGSEEVVMGMVYCSVPLDKVSLPLGRGGRVCNCLETNTIQLSSVFNKVFVNGERIQHPFIMVLQKEDSNNHAGRRSIKYTDKATYEYQNGRFYSNSDFINRVYQKFGLSEDACWFVYDISVKNYDELHLKAIFVNKDNSEEYFNSRSRSEVWTTLIEEVGDSYRAEYRKPDYQQELPLQQIFYGAPGTGKSHTINEKMKGESVIRTTFHPDSDYSTFVGAYKPTMGLLPICDDLGTPLQIMGKVPYKEQIIYEFVDQAFLQAYVKAWKNIVFNEGKKQFLVIEEINRGNCAQIFGDLFQLLDRNDYGFSDYPINADGDMQKFLKKAFARTDEPDKQIFLQEKEKQSINQQYKGNEDVISKVFAGEILLLPSNLHIWATMNTSDQSLFPIDSAFKRRWDWKYVPIAQGYDENGKTMNWVIEANGNKYDWWSFLKEINAHIGDTTHSEDKKLGYFFCKANNGVISADTFVSKVIFYLWNDVFKDYGFEDSIFKDEDGTELSFGKFYKSDVKGIASVQEYKVELFLNNLEVKIVGEKLDGDDGDDGARVSDTNMPYKVTFPDGEIICKGSGWETYVASLQKIGLYKALPFGEMYSRLDKTLPLITKNKIADQGVYKYYEVDGYYVLSGTDSQHRLLKRINKDLNLGLTIE